MVVALLGIAFASLLIFVQLGFMGALFETAVLPHRALSADIVISSASMRQLDGAGTFPRRRLLQALEVPGVAEATPLYYGSLDWLNPVTNKRAKLGVFGVDPDADVFRNPEVRAQMWQLRLPDTLLFDRSSRGDWGAVIRRVAAGEAVTTEVSGRTATIAGLFAQGASFGVDGSVVTSESTWLNFNVARAAGTVTLGLVRVAPGQDPAAVAAALRRHLPPGDVRVQTYPDFIESEQAFLRTDSPIAFIFTFGAVMGFVVGTAITYQVLSGDVNDHLAEYATFKAMGYSHAYLLGVVFEEALILAVLGFIPSLAAALALYASLASATSMPIDMPFERPILVFAATLAMCFGSGALATRKLAAADPAEVF
jgi:putative ABC transport system permease protein